MQSEKIESYLVRLAAELDARGLRGRDDILQEIRGYLVDAGQRGEARLDAALTDLGTPEELSRTYQTEARLAEARVPTGQHNPPRIDFRRAGHGAAAVAVGLISIPFFLLCASFLSVAFVKLVSPEGVPGVVGKFRLGALVRTPEAHEIFGWLLLPLGLLLAALCFFAAVGILKAAGGRLLVLHREASRNRPALTPDR